MVEIIEYHINPSFTSDITTYIHYVVNASRKRAHTDDILPIWSTSSVKVLDNSFTISDALIYMKINIMLSAYVSCIKLHDITSPIWECVLNRSGYSHMQIKTNSVTLLGMFFLTQQQHYIALLLKHFALNAVMMRRVFQCIACKMWRNAIIIGW